MTDEVVLRLAEGETAVVGYGLLLSKLTVDRTLRRRYDGPFVLADLEGWSRSWNASMPNTAFYFEHDEGRSYPPRILYLNAHPEAGGRINCSVFVVDQDDLEALDAREWIYDRIAVKDDLRGVRIVGGDVVVYSCKEEHLVEPGSDPHQLALRRSFLRLLDEMLDGLDPDLRAEFVSTTEPTPEAVVVEDEPDPKRPNPWEAAGQEFTSEVPREPGTKDG